MITYTVDYCQYNKAQGESPASLFLRVSQVLDGKEWSKMLVLHGDDAKNLWDAYTSETEQSTIQALLAQE